MKPKINQMSPIKKLALIFIAMILGYTQLYSQVPRRDSLQYQIKQLRLKKDFNPHDSHYINMLMKLGDEIRYYNSDSLHLISNEVLKLASESGNKFSQCNSLTGIGNFYEDQGNYDKAIYYYQKAYEVAKRIKDDELLLGNKLLLGIENSIANVYYYKGDYAESLSRYLKSIELASLIGDNKMLAILNENIASLYADQNDYDQAIGFFKIVKKLNEKIGDEINTAKTMSNLASVYADMGKLEYAMYNINSSIGVFEKHKIMDWLAYAYEVKGKAYLESKDYKWALFWYKQGEMMHHNVDDDRGETSLLNGIAEAYLGQHKDSLSEVYAQKAFELSKRLKFHEEIQKSANTLYRINKNKGDLKSALTFHELYQTLHDTIISNKNEKSLTMLVTKLDFEEQKEKLILENEKALASQKRYIYIALLILVIFLVITLIVRRNEKVQKRLNVELYNKTAKLVENEKKLRATNETKDKLFSIIGHDLRGPIAAFQGLLQLYRNGEIGSNDFLQFIPKLGKDLDNISFTLNNLLSWGQTQMNGSTTKPSIICLENLVNDNINLLEETATAKSIRIVNKIKSNVLSWADNDHIDIVFRNLLSNAIKFTPENGKITIDVSERSTSWEISVKDTGVGINLETQKKLFKKNSSITTYGTNDEKGTGLGLSLCKEMVEKNNGEIWVESTIPNGSCFYFTLPKMRNKFQKAG
ncbi:tetratricopeptide repeat-containing sensor histidine kinase [Maribacter sp. TH_r10]|uniref:ATP-binding protein n=1 Tax=Maribacter TaxID=252356 RepID=UPI001FE47D1A|nr:MULTISPECIES: tetratricopeptide repeat-containing sensor histidine kinase [Maribacter]MDV7138942.1 tetratricopeptide repeat-containing sensor histidine kinase [Maribacter sp. TH_r10]